MELKKDQTFILTSREVEVSGTEVSITYKELVNDVSVGTTILIDDGLIAMKVVKCTDKDIICKVENSGFVSNHKGVNVPGVHLSMPLSVQRTKRIFYLALKRALILSRLHLRGLRRISFRSGRYLTTTTARQ